MNVFRTPWRNNSLFYFIHNGIAYGEIGEVCTFLARIFQSSYPSETINQKKFSHYKWRYRTKCKYCNHTNIVIEVLYTMDISKSQNHKEKMFFIPFRVLFGEIERRELIVEAGDLDLYNNIMNTYDMNTLDFLSSGRFIMNRMHILV